MKQDAAAIIYQLLLAQVLDQVDALQFVGTLQFQRGDPAAAVGLPALVALN